MASMLTGHAVSRTSREGKAMTDEDEGRATEREWPDPEAADERLVSTASGLEPMDLHAHVGPPPKHEPLLDRLRRLFGGRRH
jgi:hypothetical protein